MATETKEPTMSDVALHCGVSIATVSCVINRKPLVRQETVDRITKAMKELGYVPRPPGRRRGMRCRSSKILRKTNRIALVTFGMLRSVFTSPIYTMVFHGVQEGAHATGKSLSVIDIKHSGDVNEDAIKGVFDGLIVFGTPLDERLRRRLCHSHCVRIMGTINHDEQWDHITYNNNRIGILAGEHLLGKGHRVCGYIGETSGYWGRCKSFKETVERGGAACLEFSGFKNVVNDTENSVDRASLSIVLDRLLSTSPRPTAIFCPADMVTAAIYPLLWEKCVAPGRDIDVVSCNNEEILLANLHPRPTVVDIHGRDVGRRAAEHLAWRFEHPDDPVVKMEIEPEIVVETRMGT